MGRGGEEGGVVLFGMNMVVTAEGYFAGSVVVWGWGTTRFGTGILAIWMGLVCGELPAWGKVGLRGNDCGGDVMGGERGIFMWYVNSRNNAMKSELHIEKCVYLINPNYRRGLIIWSR